MEQLIELMPLEVVTEAGNFYPLSIIEEASNDFNKRIEDRNGTPGECGIPPLTDFQGPPEIRYLQVDLARVSHIVRHTWIDGHTFMCKVFLLGKYAQLAQEMNFDFLGIPRATGSFDDSNVCNKYTLITVDLALPELT